MILCHHARHLQQFCLWFGPDCVCCKIEHLSNIDEIAVDQNEIDALFHHVSQDIMADVFWIVDLFTQIYIACYVSS